MEAARPHLEARYIFYIGNMFRVNGPLCQEFTGHRWPPPPPPQGQWRGMLLFTFICAWMNNREAGDLKRQRSHYDITVIFIDKGTYLNYDILWLAL